VLVSYNEPSLGAAIKPTVHDSQPAATKPTKATTTTTTSTGSSSTPTVHRIHKVAAPHSASAGVDKSHLADAGVVTVVYKNPSGVLAVDVSLMHR